MMRFSALLVLANVVSSELSKAIFQVAARGEIACLTVNGIRRLPGLTMRLFEWDIIGPNDLLNVTTTNGGMYYLEGQEDEIGLTLFYTEVWFPCEGPVFDHCINTAYHSQCIALKERRNCHLVVEFLRIPKEKHYVEDKDKNIHNAGRYLLGYDPISRTYMKCD
ncbi:hypothetical protein PRIPAC_98103 [Pristionchus pacificus]|uniref:Uncharacterized protein n=1 Tax=Pristionchus pacificus TaxID=54126 RepID=A0A2A6BZ91_PRIPA|nr:hypothetical protein PRIPAC_98087 [Pristionchus pacificus]KAF8353494.1 hypothetical protein PRIPAC_98103 [Pristionchus pacificus]|eukprot:PDM71093.1 hypothetical protein PRIPAC_46471 [Pristionchus pacificus]